MSRQDPDSGDAPRQRLDKWLFFARFAKSRSLAQKMVAAGNVRVNGAKTVKPDALIGPGDVLTLVLDRDVRVVKLVSTGERRGPYREAILLYEVFVRPAVDAGPS